MSDFSELCPLFNTGVFNEIVFPNIVMSMTTMSATATAYNMLMGSQSIANSQQVTCFTFGRTVIVTEAWLKRDATFGVAHLAWLRHHTSKGAAGTVIGSLDLTTTICGWCITSWKEFDTVTAKTFTSDEVLGLGIGTFTVDATLMQSTGTGWDLIVRYKEK